MAPTFSIGPFEFSTNRNSSNQNLTRIQMVKSYYKWVPDKIIGIITTPEASILYDTKGTTVITPCLQDVGLWSLRKGEQIKVMHNSSKPSNITALSRSDFGRIAVGYHNGGIAIFNIDGTEEMSTTGHNSAVRALAFNKDGSQLASGGDDTDICVWDVINSTGLCRLKGHKGPVSGVAFLDKINCVITSSRDTLMKVWELDTQHCIQTIIGTRNEIWGMDVDFDQNRLVVGSIDSEIRFWDLSPLYEEGKEVFERDVVFIGSVHRKFENRIISIRFSKDGGLVAFHGDSNILEVLKKRSEKELNKKVKEIAKKKELKEKKKEDEELEEKEETFIEWKHLTEIRAENKIRSFDFHPSEFGSKSFKVIVGTLRNSVEEYHVTKEQELIHTIDREGHGAPIRAVALSSDDQTFVSVSNNQTKLWNVDGGVCIKDLPCEGAALCAVFVPGNHHFLVGMKSGFVDLFEIASMSKLETYQCHDGPIYSIILSPDKQGIITCGDKTVKFWNFVLTDSKLELENEHVLKMSDNVNCIQASADGKFLAIALLDSTVKVFFLDSLKFYLSLYGHKLPVNTVDISSDGTLLITGSSDKNIKIWGMDFGDCHKSIFAHQDSITCVQFVKNTHYFVSCSRDGGLKIFDADSFENIQEIRPSTPSSPLYSLTVNFEGDRIITAGHERAIIIFNKTEEQYFLEEEQERKAELEYEKDIVESQQFKDSSKDAALIGKKTIETITTGEKLIENIQYAMDDDASMEEYELEKHLLEKPEKNPMLLGMETDQWVWHCLKKVKKSEIELVISLLPFKHGIYILKKIDQMQSLDNIEMASKITFSISEIFQNQIMSDTQLFTLMVSLSKRIKGGLVKERNLIGFNLAALGFVKKRLENEKQLLNIDEAIGLKKHKDKKVAKEKAWEQGIKKRKQDEIETKDKIFASFFEE